MRIIFFGSSQYCLPILNVLINNFNLKGIITASDKQVGRKQILSPSPVKQFALSHNLQYFTPSDKNQLLTLYNKLNSLNIDLFVVADYGMIIPEKIFSLPRHKTINIHFSRLPEYRGPSPVQYTILNGEKSAWISFMLMAKDLDTGDILKQIEFSLQGNETSGSLYTDLFNIAADNLVGVINDYIKGELKPIPQDHTKATFTKMFNKEDGYIQLSLKC